MSPNRARLEVVELDARLVPSVTKGHALLHTLPSSAILHTTAIQAPAHSILHPALNQPQAQGSALSGTGSGFVGRSPAHVRGGGTLYTLRGTANLSGMGQVSVIGGVTYFANGTASGTLIFNNGSESVSLHITASNQSGSYSYQVTRSNVAGASVGTQGTLTLSLSLSAGTFSLTI